MGVPFVFRKPNAYIMVPFGHLCTANKYDLMITKNHIFNKTKKRLSFSEIFSRGVAIAYSQEEYDNLKHPIILVPGSELEELFGDAPRIVNSIHHQAARRIGAALTQVASSPDDVTEALTRTADGPWVLGVQFHPEWMFGSEIHRTIFARFMERVPDASDA